MEKIGFFGVKKAHYFPEIIIFTGINISLGNVDRKNYFPMFLKNY